MSSGGLDNSGLMIRITPNAPLISYLQNRSSMQEISIRLFERHADDSTGQIQPKWVGRLAAHSRKDLYVEILCETIVTSMRRVGLRRTYQRSCSYALYGNECRAPRMARNQLIPPEVGGTWVRFGDGWHGGYLRASFLGGYVRWIDRTPGALHSRFILDTRSTGLVYLDGSTEGLTTAVTVSVFVGCNHLLEDCLELHNNINNFGGNGRSLWRIP